MTTTTSSKAPRRAGLLTAAAILAALAGGCDKHDETTRGVRHASGQLRAIGGGEGPAVSDQLAKQQYSKVVADLKPVSTTGGQEENAAAVAMIAHSSLALAQPSLDRTAELEAKAVSMGLVTRDLVTDWIAKNASAGALEQYDPSAVIKQAEAQIGEKNIAAENARKTKAALDAQIAELRRQAEEKNTQAKSFEQTYASLREQASKLSATAAQSLIEQAASARRDGDRLRNDGALINAKADQLVPQSAEQQLQIDQFGNQRKSLEGLIANLLEQQKRSKAEAAAARANAEKVARELEGAVEALQKHRSGELQAGIDESLKALRDSGATSRGAKGPNASLTNAAILQATGDLHWNRAQGIASYAAVMEALATATPALPQKASYAKEVEEAAKARKDALEEAKAAYEAAASAFGGSGARGASRDRIERIQKRLEDLRAIIDGKQPAKEEPKAETTTAATAPETKPAESPAAAADSVPAELKTAALAVVDTALAGDMNALRALLYITPETQPTIDAIVQIGEGMRVLDKACSAKFGKRFSEAASESAGAAAGGLGGILDAVETPGFDPNSLTYTMKGSAEAEVSSPQSSGPSLFRLSDSKWLLDLEVAKLPPQFGMAVPHAPKIKTAILEVAGEVEAGTYADINAVLQAYTAKLIAALTPGTTPPNAGG